MGSALFGEPRTPAQVLELQCDALRDTKRSAQRQARKATEAAAKAEANAKAELKQKRVQESRHWAGVVLRQRTYALRYLKLVDTIDEVLASTTEQTVTVSMQSALVRTTRVLHRVGQALPGPLFAQIMAQYQQATQLLALKQEAAKEAVQGALDAMEPDGLADPADENEGDEDAQIDAYLYRMEFPNAPTHDPQLPAKKTSKSDSLYGKLSVPKS